MSYDNVRIVSDGGPKGATKPRAYSAWVDIRERSVAEFVNRVSRRIGAPRDRDLRDQLYEAVFRNGQVPVRYRGYSYTAPMLLDLYFRSEDRVDAPIPFQHRADWDEFCEAMRVLRSGDQPMLCRDQLLRIGETIEARQRPHAEQKGWINEMGCV